MPGFGREPFGKFPFGKSNYGKDTTVRVAKSILRRDTDEKALNYLLTISNSMNKRRAEIDNMETIVNPDKVRADILRFLGKMIAIDLDENEPVEFQRTLVRDAVQYYQIKGTKKAYSIRGLISGFDVEVIPIWNVSESLIHLVPQDNRLEFPPGSGSVSGIWYTDLPPDQVSGIGENVSGVTGTVPIEGNCDYCLTSFIKVQYTLKKVPPGPVVGNLLDRVIQKVRDVTPIHIRDLFIDLTVVIQTDELNPGACLFIDEEATMLASFVDRYDIIPADVQQTDFHIPSVLFG